MRKPLLLLIALFAALLTRGAAAQEVAVPRGREPPVMDGKCGDPAYE